MLTDATPRWQWMVRPSAALGLRLLWLIVAAGVLLRLSQWWTNRSFWLDEASVVLNLLDKNWRQLMGRLDYAQSAPPLFLWMEDFLLRQFGLHEWLLRLPPLLFGIGGLLLMARLAWRQLGPTVAPWIVAWFAFCSDLVWHSVVLKQYSGDVFIALVFLEIALQSNITRRRRWWTLVCIATVAIWMSQPVIFIFGGVSLALWPRRQRGPVAGWIAGNMLVGASFALMYFFMRHQRVPGLMDFWQADMADWSRPWTIPLWLGRETYRLLEVPYKALGPLMALLVMWGIVRAWRDGRRRLLAVCLLPIALTMLAGLLRRYPYHGGRITLFLIPGIMLLGGYGVRGLLKQLKMPAKQFWWLAAAPMLAIGVVEAVQLQWKPMGRSHMRPLVAWLAGQRTATQAIYLVAEGTEPHQPVLRGGQEFLVYWPHPDALIYFDLPPVQKITADQFWIVFPFLPRHGTRYLDGFLASLAPHAREIRRHVVPQGAAAVLFERR